MIPEILAALFFGLLLLGLHRKVVARIQKRPGPPVWQEFLHAAKFFWKQTWVPKTASSLMFVGIVLVGIGIWVAALLVVIAGGNILIIFGIYMLQKIVEHGFGLSSGSPYGKFGGVRSVISAASEIPLFVSVAAIALFTHSLALRDIVAYQAVHGPLLLIVPPAAFAMFLVLLSKMPGGPFSVVEGKELVSGYKTEHFGFFRAGLYVCDGLKTTVLLWTFVLVFIGGLPTAGFIIVMVILMIILSFTCALTPMLTPFDSVTLQTLVTGAMLVYVGCIAAMGVPG